MITVAFLILFLPVALLIGYTNGYLSSEHKSRHRFSFNDDFEFGWRMGVKRALRVRGIDYDDVRDGPWDDENI